MVRYVWELNYNDGITSGMKKRDPIEKELPIVARNQSIRPLISRLCLGSLFLLPWLFASYDPLYTYLIYYLGMGLFFFIFAIDEDRKYHSINLNLSSGANIYLSFMIILLVMRFLLILGLFTIVVMLYVDYYFGKKLPKLQNVLISDIIMLGFILGVYFIFAPLLIVIGFVLIIYGTVAGFIGVFKYFEFIRIETGIRYRTFFKKQLFSFELLKTIKVAGAPIDSRIINWKEIVTINQVPTGYVVRSGEHTTVTLLMLIWLIFKDGKTFQWKRTIDVSERERREVRNTVAHEIKKWRHVFHFPGEDAAFED